MPNLYVISVYGEPTDEKTGAKIGAQPAPLPGQVALCKRCDIGVPGGLPVFFCPPQESFPGQPDCEIPLPELGLQLEALQTLSLGKQAYLFLQGRFSQGLE